MTWRWSQDTIEIKIKNLKFCHWAHSQPLTCRVVTGHWLPLDGLMFYSYEIWSSAGFSLCLSESHWCAGPGVCYGRYVRSHSCPDSPGSSRGRKPGLPEHWGQLTRPTPSCPVDCQLPHNITSRDSLVDWRQVGVQAELLMDEMWVWDSAC